MGNALGERRCESIRKKITVETTTETPITMARVRRECTGRGCEGALSGCESIVEF